MVAKLLRLLTLLTGLLFTLTGVQWWVMPEAVAPQFGLTLDTGLGLSSQIGDMSAFFFAAGVLCLYGAVDPTRGLVHPGDSTSSVNSNRPDHRLGSARCRLCDRPNRSRAARGCYLLAGG